MYNLLDTKISKKQFWTFLFFIVLFILAAFRPYTVGTDTMGYVIGYFSPNLSVQNRNIGFNIFQEGLRIFSTNRRFFLFVTSFIIQFLIYKAIVRYTKYPLFAICIYIFLFYPSSLNIMRQFIVMSLFYYYGVEFIANKKLLKFILLIVILFTFHELSLIFLPMFFFTRKLYSKNVYLFVWIGSFIFLITNQISTLAIYSTLLDRYLKILLPNLPNYFVNMENLIVESVSMNGVFLYQIIFGSIFYFLFFNKKDKEPSKTTVIFFNIFFWGIVFQNIFFLVEVVSRLSIALLFAVIMLPSNLYNKSIYKYALLMGLSALFIVRFVINGVSGVF